MKKSAWAWEQTKKILDNYIHQLYTAIMMLRTQIYIPKDLHQQVKLNAQMQKKSMADVIRKLIISGLAKEQKKLKLKSLDSIAKLNITGGPKDLSSNMDKYLYG